MFNLKNLTLCFLFLLPTYVNAAQEFKFVGEFGDKGEGKAQFAKTLFMAFGPDGAIYITDTDNFRIQKFDEMGGFVFDIQMEVESEFRFINPTAIAIGTDSSIYVMDWMFVQISAPDLQTTSEPKIFNYGPCIHKFDAHGVFVASYPIQDLSQRIKELETAVPGLDAHGNYALIIPQGDTKRKFLLAIDVHGNLYVCDSDSPNKVIVKLDANGKRVARYPLAQPGAGHLRHPVDMTVDGTGNLYIADEKGHRVLKYSADGKFLNAFGEYGDASGKFIAPFRITALTDGTLLIADTAKYLKDFVSTLPRRLDDPIRYYGNDAKLFRYRLRRIQRFTTDGVYTQKLLIPFRREVETDVALQLKGIDGSGNLYYLNPAKLRFRKYAPTTSLISSMFQTELKLRYTRDLHDVEIDNQDDLDADLYTKSDFDEQIIRDAAYANLIFSYDFNEAYRVALSNRLTYVRMTDTSYYRARDFEDFRGRFNQDDRATENSWDDRVQIDFTWIRDHRLYNYREARAFAYFSLIRLDFINDALDPFNLRFFDFNANLSDWGAGLHYDLSRTFRLNFEITHFLGENRYTYIDETNVLYATGFQEGGLTRAVLFINGIF
ncbi:MAG: NHL repeat-containing protein [Candidatus Poribacteria bacterium]|nr:NHL repeat-containing protein [Candidatus Poribacteria bacterium]